jgi:hypothetical protein
MVYPKCLMFRVYSWSGSDVEVVHWWRQGLIFIHVFVEIKRTRKVIASHWKGLRVTHKGSQIFLAVWMTPCELFLLTKSYSWLSSGLSLRLEVGGHENMLGTCSKQSTFWIWKVSTVLEGSVVSLWLQLILNKYVRIKNSCNIISKQIPRHSDRIYKGEYKRKLYPNTISPVKHLQRLQL